MRRIAAIVAGLLIASLWIAPVATATHKMADIRMDEQASPDGTIPGDVGPVDNPPLHGDPTGTLLSAMGVVGTAQDSSCQFSAYVMIPVC